MEWRPYIFQYHVWCGAIPELGGVEGLGALALCMANAYVTCLSSEQSLIARNFLDVLYGKQKKIKLAPPLWKNGKTEKKHSSLNTFLVFFSTPAWLHILQLNNELVGRVK